jgi:NAD(P)-dependent dehydrogenase (short-subunit alcohol dehydrogenase family)
VALPAQFALDGKVAVVTGAAGGLGAEFATAMAEAGADVACGDIDEAGLAETVRAVEALGRRAVAVRCDVTDDGQVAELMAVAVGELGRLDILFNNAGVADGDHWLLHDYPTDEWRRVLAIDLDGVFFGARAALKVMERQGTGGKIVNVASMWGLAGSSSLFPAPAYTAAKGAVVNLTRELGLQYAARGVQVNALCPGFYRTNLGPYEDPEFCAALEGFIPMGRIAAAEEIRAPALFLASPASDYMTGQTLVMDGGCLAK